MNYQATYALVEPLGHAMWCPGVAPLGWTLRLGKKYKTDLYTDDSVNRIGWLENEAHAAHIVRCVNAHDDLVAALIAVISVADRATVEFDMARAAIAKATA